MSVALIISSFGTSFFDWRSTHDRWTFSSHFGSKIPWWDLIVGSVSGSRLRVGADRPSVGSHLIEPTIRGWNASKWRMRANRRHDYPPVSRSIAPRERALHISSQHASWMFNADWHNEQDLQLQFITPSRSRWLHHAGRLYWTWYEGRSKALRSSPGQTAPMACHWVNPTSSASAGSLLWRSQAHKQRAVLLWELSLIKPFWSRINSMIVTVPCTCSCTSSVVEALIRLMAQLKDGHPPHLLSWNLIFWHRDRPFYWNLPESSLSHDRFI